MMWSGKTYRLFGETRRLLEAGVETDAGTVRVLPAREWFFGGARV